MKVVIRQENPHEIEVDWIEQRSSHFNGVGYDTWLHAGRYVNPDHAWQDIRPSQREPAKEITHYISPFGVVVEVQR